MLKESKALICLNDTDLVIDSTLLPKELRQELGSKGIYDRKLAQTQGFEVIRGLKGSEGKIVRITRRFTDKATALAFRDFLFSLSDEDFFGLQRVWHRGITLTVEGLTLESVEVEQGVPVCKGTEASVEVEGGSVNVDGLTVRKAQGYYEMFISFGRTIEASLERIKEIFGEGIANLLGKEER